MLGHISFGVSDLARSTRFYDAVLGAIGSVRVWTDDSAAGFGMPGGQDLLALKVQPLPVVAPGPGFHLAFNAPDRGAVDNFHSAAIANGGTDAGPPGVRLHYGDHYYAAFVIDPDGHKLEAVFQQAP